MINLLHFHEFSLNEAKRKKRPASHPYFKGLSKATADAKKRAMKRQTKMKDDDPSAYKPLPGDEKGKKMLRKSVHTQRYEDMY